MKLKKTLSLFLALVLCLGLTPTTALAAGQTYQAGDVVIQEVGNRPAFVMPDWVKGEIPKNHIYVEPVYADDSQQINESHPFHWYAYYVDQLEFDAGDLDMTSGYTLPKNFGFEVYNIGSEKIRLTRTRPSHDGDQNIHLSVSSFSSFPGTIAPGESASVRLYLHTTSKIHTAGPGIFSGDVEDHGGLQYTVKYTVLDNMDPESVWVSFDSNGGSSEPGKTIVVGERYGSLPTPTRKGYTFDGWYTSSTGGSQVTSSTTVSNQSNHTLYAHWTEVLPVQITISFDSTGGSSVPSKTVTVGQTYGSLPTPTREGYTFDGWYYDTVNVGQVTSSDPVFQTYNHTLYARWAAAFTVPLTNFLNISNVCIGIEKSGNEQVFLYPVGTVFQPQDTAFWVDMPDQKADVTLTGTNTMKLVVSEMFTEETCTWLVRGVGNGTTPEQPTTPVEPEQPAKPAKVRTANPTNDKLTVNGTEQTPTVYKIGGSNYFKIRDVAAVLNGTEKQFNVGYSGGKVTVTSNHSYDTATGKELKGAPTSSRTATRSNDTIIIDGKEASLTVYKIGGSNYFKLRDLGKALDFYVGYSGGKVTIDTSKSYSK